MEEVDTLSLGNLTNKMELQVPLEVGVVPVEGAGTVHLVVLVEGVGIVHLVVLVEGAGIVHLVVLVEGAGIVHLVVLVEGAGTVHLVVLVEGAELRVPLVGVVQVEGVGTANPP